MNVENVAFWGGFCCFFDFGFFKLICETLQWHRAQCVFKGIVIFVLGNEGIV